MWKKYNIMSKKVCICVKNRVITSVYGQCIVVYIGVCSSM